MKYFASFMFTLFLFCLPVQAAVDEVSFSSDTMQYDYKAGRFYAEGNVTIKGREMTIIATIASGDTSSKVFNLLGNITISGIWNGDNVSLAAMSATAELGAQPRYTLESGISGNIGKINVDCEYLQMVGDDFLTKNVRKFQDLNAGISFSASNVKGIINNGELTQAEAEGNIIIRGTQDKKGGIVELRGRKAIYSIARGTVVISGGVSATQGKRTFKADSLVYIPATNRIEAQGSQMNRPQITIDINDESLPKRNK